MRDYYQVLEVSKDATETEIRAAYRKKAKIYHPDVNKSPEAHTSFLVLTTAYEALLRFHQQKKHLAASTTSSSDIQTYQEWVQAKKAQAAWEAQLRYQEFLKNREMFRKSKYYTLAKWITHIVRFLAYSFGIGLIGFSFYLVYSVHFMFFFCLLPFICGGVYLIKWTDDWYKDSRRYF